MKEENRLKIKPSRSSEKRAAHAVEDLARQLVQTSQGEMENLPLEADLKREIGRVRKIRGHGAVKREIKHLAALLRRDPEETEKIRECLEDRQSGDYRNTEDFHRLEELRERLCAPATGEKALLEIESLLSPEERARLQKLIHTCLHSKDKKAYREIYRLLRSNLDSGT